MFSVMQIMYSSRMQSSANVVQTISVPFTRWEKVIGKQYVKLTY